MMKTLKFKCKLLSDIILNQKAATEGPNKTLDFIPGSCFLGIVANQLYKDNDYDNELMEIVHSGKVRFGDAHPTINNIRGLKIPSAMFQPKLDKSKTYIHHRTPNLESVEMRKLQLKQCRQGFYIFTGDNALEIKTQTNFAIKSAYDNQKRRSKDAQMYGYESLQKGLEMCFEVQVDNELLSDKIKNLLIGKKRVGRSRTAQYGLIEIEEFDYDEIKSNQAGNDGIVEVYAESRLIFLDEYGLPTFQPTAKDLGLSEDSKIIWEKSQIRTFQYAPWNFTRQCFDADRCGIEKGSVFYVETSQNKIGSNYVGFYQNEGFGKVIYNPDFLKADSDGIAKYQIKKLDNEIEKKENISLSGTNLLKYINEQKGKEDLENNVYKIVNDWINKNKNKFNGDRFASQWGTIRSIAMTHSKLEELKKLLYGDANAYLTHGVAAEKWSERGRLRVFKDFVEQLNEKNCQIAIINLAAEMAKKCKEDK